jgi:hypothetical protein
MLSATATGCGGNQPALREVCTIHTEREPGLPRLYRRANAGTLNLGPAQLLCGVPKQDRKPADRCEDVDDLSALLGTGKVCGPMGTESQAVCPRYADDRLQPEAPTQPAAPCAGACDNRQIVVREASGTATRVLFYDDPECHSAGDPLCPGSARPCYYRVLSITSELR